jgi:hypothetical protein
MHYKKYGILNVRIFQIVGNIEKIALTAHDFWSLKDVEWLNVLVIFVCSYSANLNVTQMACIFHITIITPLTLTSSASAVGTPSI